MKDLQNMKLIYDYDERMCAYADTYIDYTGAECDINCDDHMCPYTHPVRRFKEVKE